MALYTALSHRLPARPQTNPLRPSQAQSFCGSQTDRLVVPKKVISRTPAQWLMLRLTDSNRSLSCFCDTALTFEKQLDAVLLKKANFRQKGV